MTAHLGPRRKAWRVEVEWEDCQLHGGGWFRGADALGSLRRSVKCYSVGLLLVDNKRGVVLASSVNGPNVFGVVSIPRSQIMAMRRLAAR